MHHATLGILKSGTTTLEAALLGLPGIIRGVVVDTSHFKGNYPEHCSLEACSREGRRDAEEWPVRR